MDANGLEQEIIAVKNRVSALEKNAGFGASTQAAGAGASASTVKPVAGAKALVPPTKKA